MYGLAHLCLTEPFTSANDSHVLKADPYHVQQLMKHLRSYFNDQILFSIVG